MNSEHSEKKHRTLGALLVCLVGGLLAIALFNYFSVQRHIGGPRGDPRGRGVHAWAHYRYFVVPGELVFDLRAIDDRVSPADVTRVLFSFASEMKHAHFQRVVLASHGEDRFLLTGDFFQQLGAEFGTQNPLYTIRTLPQNVYNMDGTPAFGTWSGGLLGVLTKQMEDFNEFHRRWYINDLVGVR